MCDKVVTYVDGVNEKSATMDYELKQPVMSTHSSSLFLGHSRSVSHQLPTDLSCQLGNVFFFNGWRLLFYDLNCFQCTLFR